MKTTIYYQQYYCRRNMIRDFLYDIFLFWSSYPRLVMEVFLRKNMGERYYNLMSALTVFVILWYYPKFMEDQPFSRRHYYGSDDNTVTAGTFATWYIFLFIYLGFAIWRKIEIIRLPSVFDFARFSKSQGDTFDFVHRFNRRYSEFFEITPYMRKVVLEPLVFFIPGYFLKEFGQHLGYLFIFCSVFYAISSHASFRAGDEIIMDHIDNIIANEEMSDTFINDEPPSETRGFEVVGTRPDNPLHRKTVVDSFWSDGFEKII